MLSYSSCGRLDSPAILFLHGYLGAKEDWDPTIRLLQDRFFCVSIDLPNSLEKITHFLEPRKYALAGYSMGGRVALMLQKQFPSLFSHLFLFSAHPGLKTEREKKERADEERRWQEKLNRLPLPAFLKEWYTQPLFQSLAKRDELFQKILQRRIAQEKSAVAHFPLSEQPYFSEFSIPTYFVYGEEDLKYETVYRTLGASASVKKVARCGHALHLENPSACAEIIREHYV